MPDKCLDIVTALKEQYNLDLITTYHGKISSNKQKKTLTGWKTGLYRYIVATNAFEISIHIADIKVIIHTTFPISITNLVQEIGHAAHDDNPGKSIIFYLRKKLLRMIAEGKLISFGREELVDIFLKAENKNTKDKNLSLFWNEEEDASYKPIISTRD
ncbi:16579_t:CDS:2, partial [Racocetra persica]